MNREDEKEIIQTIKAGDYRQFERLIVAYQKPLYVFILRMIQDEDDAKDICQDTFFKAYKKIKSFKEKSKFSSWLFQIGYRKALDFIAKKKRQRTVFDKMETKSQMASNEEEFEIKQADRAIGKIIDGLQHNHRTALHLFYKEEMTYKEIVSVMKVPINTVKSHIFRGKEIIRDKLSRMNTWNKQRHKRITMEKNENYVDKMIKENLEAGPPGMEIDIRRETMSRIEAYEGRRAKVKNIGLWIVSLFVFCAGLLSILLFEGLLPYYGDLFLRLQLDATVVKFGFQGLFLLFVLISLTVMISQVRPAKHLSRFMFLLSI